MDLLGKGYVAGAFGLGFAGSGKRQLLEAGAQRNGLGAGRLGDGAGFLQLVLFFLQLRFGVAQLPGKARLDPAFLARIHFSRRLRGLERFAQGGGLGLVSGLLAGEGFVKQHDIVVFAQQGGIGRRLLLQGRDEAGGLAVAGPGFLRGHGRGGGFRFYRGRAEFVPFFLH